MNDLITGHLTNHADTQDWEELTRELDIVAYVEPSTPTIDVGEEPLAVESLRSAHQNEDRAENISSGLEIHNQ